MSAEIIDRGRGPEIAGTRITVYDVMDYLQDNWSCEQIAGLFRLSPDDVQAALQYIQVHKDDVMTAYQEILTRHRQVKYAPTVEVKLGQNRRKLEDKLAEVRARQQIEETNAGDHGRS